MNCLYELIVFVEDDHRKFFFSLDLFVCATIPIVITTRGRQRKRIEQGVTRIHILNDAKTSDVRVCVCVSSFIHSFGGYSVKLYA